ncbi:hypothetical protein KIPB_009328, partial [Kipferlia bialata]
LSDILDRECGSGTTEAEVGGKRTASEAGLGQRVFAQLKEVATSVSWTSPGSTDEWDIDRCAAAFIASCIRLSRRAKTAEIDFDKDDRDTVVFVTAVTLQRMMQFHVPQGKVTNVYELRAIAGNIVPGKTYISRSAVRPISRQAADSRDPSCGTCSVPTVIVGLPSAYAALTMGAVSACIGLGGQESILSQDGVILKERGADADEEETEDWFSE